MSCCNTSGGFPDAGTAKQLSRDYNVIWAEIGAIQQAILKATSGCGLDPDTGQCVNTGGQFCVEITGGTPMTWQSGISAITVDAGGTGYEPIVATVVFTDSVGTGAVGTATTYSGIILDITMDSMGQDYTDDVVVSIDHPTGQEFEGTAILANGEISGVMIDNSGTLYGDLLPTISFFDVEGGGAEGTVKVDTGIVTSVTLDDSGSNYSADATAVIIPALTSPGTGAEVSLTVNTNPYGTDPYQYYLSITDQLDTCVYSDQIAQVMSHFQGLGYDIRVLVNPNTDATIMWKVCWC